MLEIGAVLKVIAEIAGATGLVEVSHRAHEWLKGRAQTHKEVDAAKQLLGIARDDVAYRHDSVHPLYSGATELHPDNLAALTAAAGDEYFRACRLGHVRTAEALTSSLNTNLVLIGSPTAEGLSRPTFGYEPDIDPDSLALGQPPIDLPLRWVLSKTQIDRRAQARRYVEGKAVVTRPNWRIEGQNKMFVPEVDSVGLLSLDYLLVTRLRNYLSHEALDKGKFILSFGGTHGTATRAIEILLRDRETLRKIAHQLEGPPAAYQFLLKVGAMNHDMSRGTRATRVELAGDPIIIPDNQQTWLYAAKVAKSNLEKWLKAETK